MSKLLPIFAVLALAGVVSAAACAQLAYSAACNRCSFDSSGKMDSACYEGKQAGGVSCLFAAYPLEAISYQMNGCPAVEVCKDRLETCKALATSGSDRTDCAAGTIDHCFANADRCVDAAIKSCDEDPPGELSDIVPPAGWCDGFFFAILPIFGMLFFRMRS
ncbi:MAG: hypothetical protein AB1324_01180 [Candidatus Micrarchaeota archaeon]